MQSGGHHPPLTRSSGYYPFRILTLEPGSEDEEIVCQLHVAYLSQTGPPEHQPFYDAVSYAWGPAVPTFTIRLGAWPVVVREGLFRFLTRIRSPTASTSLWIDALCIDQRSMDERGRQVSIMDKIYTSARRSIVWLGDADAECILAMDVMQQISDEPSKMDRVTDEEQAALLTWSHRPYWTRTWVVQEFLLARDVLIVCGSTTLGWSALTGFLRRVSGRTPTVLLPFLDSPAYHLMRQKVTTSISRLPLRRLLVENQDTQCQDPHDKVYAMLGLSTPDESRSKMVPRYDKSLAQLLLRTLEHCNVPPKEIPRYVTFLSRLLQCYPGLPGQDLPPSITSKGTKSYPLVSFRIGRVTSTIPDVDIERLRNGPDQSQLRNRRLGGMDPVKASRMLTGLENVAIESIRSYFTFLKSIPSTSSANMMPEASSQLKTVAILTSDCVHPELILGRACGDVNSGNVVQYFLGHDIGMIMSHDDNIFRGCVVCVRDSWHESKRDPVTRRWSQYWNLQTEAEVRIRDAVNHHNVEESKLLHFGIPVYRN